MHIWSNRTVYAIYAFLKRQRHNFNLQKRITTIANEKKRHWGLEACQIIVSHVGYVTDSNFPDWKLLLLYHLHFFNKVTISNEMLCEKCYIGKLSD